MRVGINLLYLLPGIVGGTESYARGLLDGLAAVASVDAPGDEFVVLVNREASDWPIPDSRSFSRVVCPVAATSRPRRYLFEQVRLPRIVRALRLDLVHSLGYVAPLVLPCPSVVTIHDMNFLVFGRNLSRARSLALRFFVRSSAARAARIVTDSAFARDEIVRELGVDRERIDVAHLAPSSAVRAPSGDGSAAVALERARLGLDGPYLIAFSSQLPHKNIPRLIAAYALARSRHALAHRLVIVGHPPPGVDIQAPPAGVMFTGYIADAVREAVLASADGLLFPSLYEGFGLPVVEAMASGVPVACSNLGPMPEIAGDAAILFDPRSVEEMADAIARLALDSALREDLVRRGTANVRRFTWENTARQALATYRRARSPDRSPAAA